MKKRVLFVDDEPRILDGLRRMLRGMKDRWDMSFVTSGALALAELEKRAFHVVVSDMRMPGIDGAALLSTVRERHPHVVRIILSGHCDKETVFRSVGLAHQYLAKPCDPDCLRQTVERACALRDLLRNSALETIVGGMETLNCLPELYLRLQMELRSEDPSIKRIGGIIEQDVGMTSKLLQLVNSAFFGLQRHIASPVEAAKLLGTETISALTLSAHVFRKFEAARAGALCLRALMGHSLAVATLARALCRAEGAEHTTSDHAFLAGMLHDAGKLALAQVLPDAYRRVVERDPDEALLTAETREFGVSHAEVAAFLFGLWGLPDPLIEAICYHHCPSILPAPTFGPLTAVHVANALVRGVGSEAERIESAELDGDFLERVGVLPRLPLWEAVAAEQCIAGAVA